MQKSKAPYENKGVALYPLGGREKEERSEKQWGEIFIYILHYIIDILYWSFLLVIFDVPFFGS